MGAFYATPEDFMKDDLQPRCVMYTGSYKSSKQSFHVAVSAKLAEECPTIPQILRAIAQSPGSCFKFCMSERKLCKFFKKTVRTTPRIQQNTFVLSPKTDLEAADKKYRSRYITPRSFLLKFPASERALCPGSRKVVG